MKTLAEIMNFLGEPCATEAGLLVKGLSLDSRQIQTDWIFVALSGGSRHGGEFWQQAMSLGALGVLSDQPLEDCKIPVYVVEDLKLRLADLAGWFYDYPSHKLKLIGVTGTNGKTSTTQYIAQMLESLGQGCGVLGTLGNGRLNALQATENTTMDSLALNAWLAKFVSEGLTFAVLEVSSHAIALGRIAGLKFECVALTQVTRDHLDFHRNLSDYQATKKRLFEAFTAKYKVVNLDDKIGQQIIKAQPGVVVGYSQNNQSAVLFVSDICLTQQGITGCLHSNETVIDFKTSLLGRFNIENILCATLCLVSLGFDLRCLKQPLAELKSIIGRMERVKVAKPDLTVLVDYAHTPDALEQVLVSVQAHHPVGKVWLVFGCGGNRDKGKRPLMADVASHLADQVILTNDNPRFEEPNRIVADICEGLSCSQSAKFEIELDRKKAIESALMQAKAGDWILVVGKGHENYQEIKGIKKPFSDQQVIEAWQLN